MPFRIFSHHSFSIVKADLNDFSCCVQRCNSWAFVTCKGCSVGKCFDCSWNWIRHLESSHFPSQPLSGKLYFNGNKFPIRILPLFLTLWGNVCVCVCVCVYTYRDTHSTLIISCSFALLLSPGRITVFPVSLPGDLNHCWVSTSHSLQIVHDGYFYLWRTMPSGYSVIDEIICVSYTHTDIMYAHTYIVGGWMTWMLSTLGCGLDTEHAWVWIKVIN